MILFPIALLWLIGVLIWAYRNNLTELGPDGKRQWTGWRPRSPRRPPGGRRDGSGSAARAGGSRQERRESRRGRRVLR
ncbi:MAG TPA: hypothetical protein VF186_10795 [Gaiellaceae bacterium]|jgi:hypothetical protein